MNELHRFTPCTFRFDFLFLSEKTFGQSLATYWYVFMLLYHTSSLDVDLICLAYMQFFCIAVNHEFKMTCIGINWWS